MDKSQVIRALVRNGLDIVERDGLDALINWPPDASAAPKSESNV
jgi:hypothetical protein